MDLDKPLDDLISDKRKTNGGPGGGGRGRGAPRQSRERGARAPYARPPPRSTEDTWVHDAYQGPASHTRRQDSRSQDPTRFAGSVVGFTGLSPRIEVVGLHYEVTPADLKTIFSQAGTLVQGPTIRYDRSGRSTGQATMEFASPQQAKVAINKFDGAMTKGQTISIKLLPPARVAPPAARGAATTGQSLLSRIQGAPSGPANNGAGAARGRGGLNNGPRGSVRGAAPRGAPRGRGGPAGGARGGKRAPATAEDLDKELEGFAAGGAAKDGQDVEMA